MLDMDYSSCRKFLISLGLNLIFISFSIITFILTFSSDRFDKLAEISKLNDTGITNAYISAYSNLPSAINIILISSIICLILGLILFFIGITQWINEAHNLKNNLQKIKNLIEKKLYVTWYDSKMTFFEILDILLISVTVTFTLKLIELLFPNVDSWWIYLISIIIVAGLFTLLRIKKSKK